ncbi:MAG: indoleamine 2,3-dioxygenase [Pseudomonadota bacterium]
MPLHQLSDYDVSSERGFLAAFDASIIPPPAPLKDARAMARSLPSHLLTGHVRRDLEHLATVDDASIDAIDDNAQLRCSLVDYSFMAQAYVWGEDSAPTQLPACIARPLWRLANRVGQPPILTYSQYVLDNWTRLDPKGAIDLENTATVQPFLGGEDEAWFILIHVAIEAQAAGLLSLLPTAVEAAAVRDQRALGRSLSGMIDAWDRMIAIFDRMPERCDPYIYFQRVRPWIHGWKDNPALPDGLVYDGVDAFHGKPKAFRGQTGSQSSIVPVMDAFLGVAHGHDPLRGYLDELHVYRPPGHRRFIDDVRASSQVRDAVQQLYDGSLTEAYNDCLDRLTKFRTRHLEYAASYIHKQSRGSDGNSTDVGTGGTPFMKYLKKHRDEARAHQL